MRYGLSRWRIPWIAVIAVIILLLIGSSFVSRMETNLGWIFLSRSIDADSANLSLAERWFQSSLQFGVDESSRVGLTQVYLRTGESEDAVRNWVDAGLSAEDALLVADAYLTNGKWEMAYAWYMLANGIKCTGNQCADLKDRFTTLANPDFNLGEDSLLVGDESATMVFLEGWDTFDQANSANQTVKNLVGANRKADSDHATLSVDIPDSSVDIVVQSSPIILSEGQEIVVRGWGKRDGSTTSARLEVQFLTKDGQHLSYGPSSSVSSIDEWQMLDLTAVAPVNAGWYVIRLRAFTDLNFQGLAEFDEISISLPDSRS